MKSCWCGNSQLVEFSSEYSACLLCGTLVSQVGLSSGQATVENDESDFYGKEYWFSHQTESYGFPDIVQRSRQDLPERCLHWLQTLLTYKLPHAKVLELGSAHGGFVALMQWAGFEATGLELSPWIVDFAQKTFNIPMLQGTVEQQPIQPQSLDAIVLYDVLEHLPDPVTTMRHCVSLLKPDGIMIVQMPNYEEGSHYADLVAENSPFLQMLTAVEHLHLFSHRSAQQFFQQLGYSVRFEAPFFPCDMFLIASQQPLNPHSPEAISETLLATPSGRLIQALLDRQTHLHQLDAELKTVSADRNEAFQIVERFGQDIAVFRSQIDQMQAELFKKQAQLEEFHSELIFTQTQLKNAQVQLEQTQIALNQTEARTREVQTDLERAQTRNQRQQERIQKQKTRLEAMKQQIQDYEDEIGTIKASKLWKMRSVGARLYRMAGLSTLHKK